MLGEPLAPAVATGEVLIERVHPDDQARLRKASLDVMNGVRADYNEEHRVRMASGHYIWIQSRGKVVARDGEGRALRMAGTSADITQRKQAEQRIQYLATR
jgi:PAS domain S-box-containing protein